MGNLIFILVIAANLILVLCDNRKYISELKKALNNGE